MECHCSDCSLRLLAVTLLAQCTLGRLDAGLNLEPVDFSGARAIELRPPESLFSNQSEGLTRTA
jgi:hypothetical protein